MAKTVVIEVDENNNITFESFGFKGKGCLEETKWIKNLLGEEKEETKKLKSEYYMKEQVVIKNHVSN